MSQLEVVDLADTFVPRLPTAQKWLRRLNETLPNESCHCKGFGPLPDFSVGPDDSRPGTPMWDYVARMDAFATSPTAGNMNFMAGKRKLIESLVVYFTTHFNEAIADCATGTASLILMSLEVIEDAHGLGYVRSLFAVSLALLVHSRHWSCRLTFASARPGFAGNYFVPYYRQLPLLLGLDKSRWRKCWRGAPRIFLELTNGPWARPVLGCSGGLAATEVWVHRLLLQSDCRASTAAEADLLFVPVYARCLYAREHNLFEKGYSWDHPFTNGTQLYRSLLGILPHFRARPQDHVFLFPEEHWPVSPAAVNFGGTMGRSLILSPEARPLRCPSSTEDQSMVEASADKPSCDHLPRRASGLIVIPSFIDGWRAAQLRAFNKPIEQRSVLACFMGLGLRKAYAMTENYRGLLRALVHIPDLLVGEYDDNYRQVMGSSIFCLVPKGVGTWSHRLYEAFLAGCIPVILSDDILLPFPQLPWRSFSMKWPMRKVDSTIFPEHLRRAWSSGAARAMKAAVDEHACWFDYHSEVEECSPLVGITRQLVDRGANLGMLGFWRISKELHAFHLAGSSRSLETS
eukprot:TRINITY_DN61778_c0_g1_i1.p1 TRINITY_DN61778_c0_g1~~TRINITY_DN61778_c0_g1_i1.p1  ORF type:complete len:573 (+),score=39.27 TRINITY_DN61778_c0_g1_i1:161-1879(+)